jgi:hypothetical protein
MSENLSRRHFLHLGMAAASLATAGAGLVPAKEAQSGKPRLTVYQDGPHIWVRLGSRVLTAYRAHPTQKYPYFFPLMGPRSGLSLTTESSLPWPHHRSLFLGCDQVNGGNYWQDVAARGQIVSQGPKVAQTTTNSVVLHDQCQWRQPGKAPVLVDQRNFRISVASEQLWFLDACITLTAAQDVKVQKTNHSLFAVRVSDDLAPTGGGRLVNSSGQVGEKATAGQTAAWCDFSGKRVGLNSSLVEGLALMDHPGNPWSPCKWFTRDYGFFSPTPFNWLDKGPWTLAMGQSVTLNYRVVLHEGTPKDADLAGIYQKWKE